MSAPEQRVVLAERSRDQEPPKRRRWHRWLIALVVLVLLGLNGTRALVPQYYPRFLDRPIAFWPGPDDSTIYREPDQGWTLKFPNSWERLAFAKVEYGGVYQLERRGVLLSNIERLGESSQEPKDNQRLEMRGQPSNLVAIQVMYGYVGGFLLSCEPEALFPLSLKNADRASTPDGAHGTEQLRLQLAFVVDKRPQYRVTAWIGEDASKSDVDALDDIVASITFENADPSTSGSYGDCDL